MHNVGIYSMANILRILPTFILPSILHFSLGTKNTLKFTYAYMFVCYLIVQANALLVYAPTFI